MSASMVCLMAGWGGILAGVVAGSIIGLHFHKPNWAGGYASFRRRMLRLGHIAFIGLGSITIMGGLTLKVAGETAPYAALSTGFLIAGMLAMPTCCFLSAARESFRVLFPLPVLCALLGIVFLLLSVNAA